MPVMTFIGNLGYVAVCILGGWLAVNSALTVGDIQAFIQYVRQFNQPITQIANSSNVLQQTAAPLPDSGRLLRQIGIRRKIHARRRIDQAQIVLRVLWRLADGVVRETAVAL